MAARLSAKIVGTEKLQRALRELSPEVNRRITEPALVEGILLAISIAASEKIKRGGKAKPLPNKLTSRDGALRRSLGFGGGSTEDAIDRSGLSRNFIEGGTDLIYGALHESGGTASVGGHLRTSKKGKRIGVRPHTRRYPPRPFLAPGLKDAERQFERIFVKHWRREIERA